MTKRHLTLGQLLFKIVIVLLFSSPAWSATNEFRIVILGDSLTEGYGISKDVAFPALLEKKFHDDGMNQVKIINAGISGSTSSSAPGRLKWILKTNPHLILLALGANDGLRAVPVETLKKNLKAAIKDIRDAKVDVVLVGMKMPPNYGKKYSGDFESVFTSLAKEEKVKLIPFLLANTAGNKELTQPDGIHPNEKGHILISDYVYNQLGELRAKLIAANPPKKKLLNPNERRPKND